jgi:hypothetical protein
MAHTPDDRRRHLRWLRREHNRAVDQFRYADASAIQSEIDRIVSDPLSPDWHRLARDRVGQLRAQYARKKRAYARARERLLELYRGRFSELIARQDSELRALSEERAQALERELTRPIAEVDFLLMRSKVFAKDHQYAHASDVYREALRRKDETVGERTAACRATFRDQKRQMAQRHAHELAVMDAAITASLEKLDLEEAADLEIIGNRHRINEFRNGVWPPAQYSLGHFHKRTDIVERFPGETREDRGAQTGDDGPGTVGKVV